MILMKDIIDDHHPLIREISQPVEMPLSQEDEQLLLDMHEFLVNSQDEVLSEKYQLRPAVGIAAVQLGIPKRIIYLKNTNLDIVNKIQDDSVSEEEKNYNEAKVLINPVILSREGLTDYWESCASCLDNFGHVRRPYKITLEYFDIDGNKHREIFEGFEATVLSHEYDHLDGILHMDIADEILVMKAEDRKKFRLEHGYNIVSKTGDYEEPMKNSEKTKNKAKS